jgi:hypothetical protein
MARPPKDAGNKRSEIFRCRLTPAETLKVRQAALRARLSIADYGRAMLLTGQVQVRKELALNPEVFDQLRRIGINLNQAVHRLHATGEIPPDLASAAAIVEALILGMMDGP